MWWSFLLRYKRFTLLHLTAFSNKKRRPTCRNSFSAVSKALMLSYGSFSSEWPTLQRETKRKHGIHEKNTVSANPKPARRARHTSTTKTPYQIHLYKRKSKLCRRTTGSRLCTSGFEAVPSLIQPKLWVLHLGPRPNKTSKAGPNPCR